MKVVVVGCTHAGTAAIVNIKNQYPDAKINVYERNDNISFLSCGIALSVSGLVKDPESLFYNSPEGLKQLGVNTFMEHEVISIDVKGKIIEAKDLKTGETFLDHYDKLVLTLGSWPIIPPIPGIRSKNVELCKNYHHAKEIIAKAEDAKKVVVVGAGYIGVELAEAFEIKGKEVVLIDAEARMMAKYLDKEVTDVVEMAFRERGVKLALGEKVERFEEVDGKVTAVVTNNNTYEADLVVTCIGFAPSSSLVKGKLDTLPNGAIIIDEYMRTSEPDIFAAGDCCMVGYNPAKDKRYIPLATNAVRMGTLIAKNLEKPVVRYMGTQGTSGIKIYAYNVASTGMTEEVAKATTNMEVGSVTITENHRPEFMPTYETVTLKLVFDQSTRRIIGGQILSKYDLTEMMNTLSVVIQNNMTVEELAFTDFFFQPHYNKPWGLLNQAALKLL